MFNFENPRVPKVRPSGIPSNKKELQLIKRNYIQLV